MWWMYLLVLHTFSELHTLVVPGGGSGHLLHKKQISYQSTVQQLPIVLNENKLSYRVGVLFDALHSTFSHSRFAFASVALAPFARPPLGGARVGVAVLRGCFRFGEFGAKTVAHFTRPSFETVKPGGLNTAPASRRTPAHVTNFPVEFGFFRVVILEHRVLILEAWIAFLQKEHFEN